jgi:hypothetical protein
MTLNGEHVSDSQFCIDLLISKYDKDLSSHLSPADRAVVHSLMKMAEESLRCCVSYHRFFCGEAGDVFMPFIIFKAAARKFRKELIGQGYGRHTKEEGKQI